MSEKNKHYEASVERLRKNHLKLTKPRLELLEILTHKHGPYSMDEFKKLMKKSQCDLVTIYRCLAQFEEVGLVRRCDFGDGVARYELIEEGSHHHHVICRKCQKVQSLDDDCLMQTLEEVVQKRGYRKVTHSLEFFGICPSCA